MKAGRRRTGVPPRITLAILNGVLAATSQVLAGDGDGEVSGRDWDDVHRADAWARAMRTWMRETKG